MDRFPPQADPELLDEDPAYLETQLITYLGNKRSLLGFLDPAVRLVREALGGRRLTCLDLFSGSGVVSRALRAHASHLIVNDQEPYAEVISRCYQANRDEVPHARLARAWQETLAPALQDDRLRPGLLSELYAPADERAIARGERVFYTPRNAAYLDTAREEIGGLAPELQPFFLGPLLAEASIHANTAGVFKGFYKNRSGVGQYGGEQRQALARIQGPIQLGLPVLSRHACAVTIHREEAAALVPRLPPVDLAYLDPPYNQHPYGANYFMLNLLVDPRRPEHLSQVSGIPRDWNRSDFNRRASCLTRLREIVHGLQARYVLLSFSSEGFISSAELLEMLGAAGEVTRFATSYPAFRGARHLRARELRVQEYLYLLRKR